MKNLEQLVQPIKQSVRVLYEAQQDKKAMDAHYEEVKKKESLVISNFMFSQLPKGTESFDVSLDEGLNYYENSVKLKVTRIRRKKVLWNVEKLKEAIGKKLAKQCIQRTYTVDDMEGLILYLKSCGVDPKRFKKFIDISEEVDEKALDQLYSTGKVKRSQIADCYKVELGEPYIRLTRTDKHGTEI